MFLLEVIFILIMPFCLIQTGTRNNILFLQFILFFVFISLFLLAGFRIISPDYYNYETYYKLLAAGRDYRDLNIVAADPFFAYLNCFFAYFSNNPLTIFLFFSLVSVGLNLSCYKKYSPYFLICIIFYISHTYVAREMMQIRAGLACALCLYSLRYILQKKIYSFFITVFIASAVHLGASIFLLAYFIGQLQIDRKYILLLLISALIVGFLYPLGHLFKQLPAMNFLQRVQYYSDSKYGEDAGILTNVIILKGIFLTLFLLYFHNELIRLNKYYLISFNLYLFSVIWYIIWNDFEILAARIATFYSITEVLLLSFIPLLMKTTVNKIISTLLLLLLASAILILNISTGKWDDIILPLANLI